MYNKETYTQMLDQLLSCELSYVSSYATESNIKNAMKRILGLLIKQHILKRYANLVLDEDLNVHLTIVDVSDAEFDIVLYYGV